MTINNREVKTNGHFAFDGCHKIYILEDEQDEQEAIEYGYSILDIKHLKNTFDESCEFRFINNWKSAIDPYVAQFENATFGE